MTITQIGDILMLDNDTAYQVMETLYYEGEDYLYAVNIPKDVVAMINEPKKKTAFLRELVDAENEEVYVQQVKDPKLIKTLSELVLMESGVKIKE